MADDAEDVLELEDEAPEVEAKSEERDGESDPPADDETEGDEPEVTVIGFEGDEDAAPASEGESSVIRELRRREREKDRRIRELEARIPQAPKVELGPEPSLESCEYDEDRFKVEWREWNARKAQAERVEQEAKERAETAEKAWAATVQAFEAEKTALGVSDFDDAEGEVQAKLPPQVQGLLLKSGKGAALVYALGRSPEKLEALSKLPLDEAAMMIGELRGKLKMEKRKIPAPDRKVTGTAPSASADKKLARLEEEAGRTGDRTKLIRYRKSLQRA